ncbi:putative RNA polymerase sigma factor FecI [Planctomycetes bacterium Poly30]|uniref:Putative RNA polymerase sigma factor FecI n=1 Tax=Saltatorellus ferox TaxID=2528018 RepID=A0A518EQK0_9BACT|nr:putative RNA polymerase sigma factor FecI [Planctomycetes bacterium Poly30]
MEHPQETEVPRMDPDRIDQHVDWLRRLARSLVHDVSLAEDLVQETALAALQAPPLLSEGSPRPWLSRVLRRRAADAARRATGRGDLAAWKGEELRREASASASKELVSEVETGQRLARLVLGMAEPTRSTLLLRFWEGLPPRKIAQRQGVPVATVKSRLARGLERLRLELDQESGGDRTAWLLAVLPMARDVRSAATITVLGGIGMNVKILSVVAGAAIISGTLYLAYPSPADQEEREAATSPRAVKTDEGPLPDEGQAANEPSIMGETPGSRESISLGEAGPGPSPPASAPIYSIEGQVLRADAIPVAGVRIQSVQSARVQVEGRPRAEDSFPDAATSGPQGRFMMETALASGSLQASVGGGWVTVRPGVFRVESGEEPLVIVASAIDLAGTVVDDWGAGVPGIEVILDLPADFVTRFDASTARSLRRDWRTTTDDEGAFRMTDVPAASGATLEATTIEGASAQIEAPVTTQEGLRITLAEPPIPEGTRLSGRVLLSTGVGAAAARIAMGDEMVRADEDGRFEIDLARSGDVSELRAIAFGTQPETFPRPGDTAGPRRGWPEDVEIRLRRASMSIAGEVVDAEGNPKAGARVWLHDPTEFGVLGAYPVRAEGLASGLGDPFEAARSRGELRRSREPQESSSATGVGESTSMLPYVLTDDRGRFEVTGLLDRSYVLNVLGPNLDFGFQSDPLRAGSRGVVLRVPTGGVYPEIRGRLVTRRGDPLPGVNVTPWVTALSKDLSVQGGSSSVTRFFYGGGVRSDDEGRFTLRSIPQSHVNFWIAGDGVTPLSVSVEEVDDPLDFLIEMAARIEVSVQILDPSLGIDGVTVQGFDGEPQEILRLFADGSSNMLRLPVEAGRTGVFALTTDADTITLMRGSEAVESIPLDGDTETVQEILR